MADRPQDMDFDRASSRYASGRGVAAPEVGEQPSRRNPWPWVIGGAAVVFSLGMIGSPWFESQVRRQMPAPFQQAQVAASDPRFDALEARVRALETSPSAASGAPVAAASPTTAGIEGRIAALEAQAAALQGNDSSLVNRLGQVSEDLARTSGAVAAGDRQVRDLFLLGVARRLVELGRPLGRVETLLAERFGTVDAPAVEALAAWSRVPQTRGTLMSRLETLDVAMIETEASGTSWWDRLKVRLSGLVTVQRSGTGPTPPDLGAVPAARKALEAGDLDVAAARIEQAPAGPARDQWLADARALAAAEAALDRLETQLLADAVATMPSVQPPVNMAPASPSPVPVPYP
jgi:hypothetical protein